MVGDRPQARLQYLLKGGGGVKTFTSTHHPLDIARVTSSTLRKIIDKHPRLDIHKHPLGHCPHDVINIPRGGGGGGDRSRSRTLCIGFQDQDKFKGGGVITPVTTTHHPGPYYGIIYCVHLTEVLWDLHRDIW